MSEYVVSDTSLTSIANAIRTKGGTSAQLEFPDEFVSAIGAISTGTDVSDTTATASDVLNGKYFYTANGTKTQGSIASKTSSDMTASILTVTAPAGHYATDGVKTLSDANLTAGNIKKNVSIFGVTGSYEGSGGGGLTYETGTYTPVSDTAQPTINFQSEHTEPPIWAMMTDITESNPSANSNMYWEYAYWSLFTGKGIHYSTSTMYYGRANYGYMASSYATFGGVATTNTTSQQTGQANLWNWVRTTCILPGSNSASRYWRSGRTYKWIAVWKPTT